MKRTIKKTTLSLVLLLCVVAVSAQDNSLLFTRGIPQSTQLNPAFRPVKKWYVAMPALGSVQINGSNTGFSWNDIIRSGTGTQADSLIIDLDYASSKMQDNNLFTTEATIQIIGFGFAMKDWFFTFDINHKLKAKVNYPLSLMNLRYGNWNYKGDVPISHSLSDLYVDGMDYNEIAFGASKPINDRLTVGLRVKYIMGVAHAGSEYMNFDMQTFEDGSLRITSDAAFRTSVPLDISRNKDGYVSNIDVKDSFGADDFIFGKNSGFGFDAGASYQLMDKLTIGAAVNDIGFVRWSNETSRFTTNGTFNYTGINVSEELTGDEGDGDYFDALIDDFEETFRFSGGEESYTTGLMGSFNVTADYQFRHWLNFGFASKNYFVEDKLVPQLTLATGVQAGRVLSGTITYSYMKNSLANLGAGMALNLGAFQVYAVTDNLTSMLKPSNAKYINARLGINFVFNGKKEKEEPEEE